MTIACIIHSLGIGGMERVMATLLQKFAQHDTVELHLLLIGRKREVLQELPEQVHLHKPKWLFNNQLRTWHTLKTLAFIRQKIKSIQPDTILSFGEMWNNLVLLALVGLPHPVYISDRSKPEKNLGRLQNWLRNRLYPYAAGYIAQTEHAKKAAIKNKWNKNIQVIGNPIPPITCPDLQRERIILSVGRLIPTKQFDRLIHVFHHIRNKDWKLIIVGGDAKQLQLSQQLKQQVLDLGLEDQVTLTGALPSVTSYYCQSAIFAFMSTSEGFPNVLGEAMSAGCACITYDCFAGPSDLIEDGMDGFLVEENNEKDFINGLRRLLEDDKLRKQYSEAAQKSIAKFSADNISRLYFDFISSHLSI